jgi:ubiquitin carboxyl-terminal hydrolase 4/11/15
LFYRRRSAAPLGGPRFQEIFDRFNQSSLDDDMSDSGEGQRLGQGSSQRGSPSASTGAGPARLRESRGWDNNRRAESERPSYRGGGVGDDADMDTTWSNQDTLHNSIEGDGEDEGIGLSDYDTAGLAAMTSVIGPSTWSFDNLMEASKPGSEAGEDGDDIASDVAQNDGSSVHDGGGVDDVFDDAPGMEHLLDAPREPGADYVEPPEPTPPSIEFAEEDDDYNLPPPPPSVVDPDFISKLAAQTWVKQQVKQQMHTVPPMGDLGVVEDDQASDKVAEIHVGDADADVDVGEAGVGAGEKSLA